MPHTVTFTIPYDANGNVIYGQQSGGYFLVSGQSGLEMFGYPGQLMHDGLQLTYNDDGSITPQFP
jgi:hypothetical protein